MSILFVVNYFINHANFSYDDKAKRRSRSHEKIELDSGVKKGRGSTEQNQSKLL